MKKIILSLILIITSNLYSQEKYKEMMYDNSVNFYDVVKEAENYFKTHDKSKKGSGWKPYQRWLYENESKYYPSGDRNNTDPNLGVKEFLKFKQQSKTKSISTLTNPWNELGPYKIDTLVTKPTAGIGRVEDFYVDPQDTDYMYISSRSGGLFKTVDGGINWEPKTDFLFSCGVNNFDVSPTNREELLINVNNSANQNSNGIYKSVDGGNSWTVTAFNPLDIITVGLGQNMRVNKLVYHPLDENVVFIGTNKGLYRSNDKLDTLVELISNIEVTDIAFHPTDENIVYFHEITNHINKIHISADKGLTFSTSNEIVGNNADVKIILSTSPACPDCLYFSSGNGVWKSTNSGEDFSFLNNPAQGSAGFSVSDVDNTIMIRGYVLIERSTDDGVSFSEITASTFANSNATDTSNNFMRFNTNTDYVHVDLHPTQCINGTFYIGTDGWFCKSENNGEDWTILNQNVETGTSIRENYKLGVSQSNHYRTITGCQDNGTAIKREEHWVDVFGGDGGEGLFHPLNYDWAIGSAPKASRNRTETGGYSKALHFKAGSENGSFVAPILYDPNNHMTLYDYKQSVWKSEDFGDTWTQISTPVFSNVIKQATIAQNNSDIMVVSRGSNIKKSIDGGATFVDIRNNLPNSNIKNIAIDPKNDDRIFVVYNSYLDDGEKIFMTENGGTTWQNITYNLGNMPLRAIAIDHTDASNIYVGAEIGMYTKPLSGTTWELYNTDLPNVAINEIEIVNASNTVRTTTWGRGTWENSLVNRESYPSIVLTEITDLPTKTTPAETVPQYVTSTINYTGTLTDVHVAWSTDNPTFDNTIVMSNSTDNIWVSDTSIPDFPEGTKIYFKVFATGSNNDTTETYKFMYTVKPFEYCLAQVTATTLKEHITNVTFGEINNTTGATSYSDFTTLSTEVTQGQSYDLTVSYNKNKPEDRILVWIDFNNNSSFDDLGEEFTFPLAPGESTPITMSIPIPTNAKLGSTRMRVRLDRTSHDDSNQTPCGESKFGEIEDYSIVIKENASLHVNDYNNTFLNVIDNVTELIFTTKNNYRIKSISIYNALGKQLLAIKNVNNTFVNLPIQIKKGQFLIISTILENGQIITNKIIKK